MIDHCQCHCQCTRVSVSGRCAGAGRGWRHDAATVPDFAWREASRVLWTMVFLTPSLRASVTPVIQSSFMRACLQNTPTAAASPECHGARTGLEDDQLHGHRQLNWTCAGRHAMAEDGKWNVRASGSASCGESASTAIPWSLPEVRLGATRRKTYLQVDNDIGESVRHIPFFSVTWHILASQTGSSTFHQVTASDEFQTKVFDESDQVSAPPRT